MNGQVSAQRSSATRIHATVASVDIRGLDERGKLAYNGSQFLRFPTANDRRVQGRLNKAILSVCRTVVGAMLFAQASIVVSACILPDGRASVAFNDNDCHKAGGRNQCLQQCTAVDQSASHAQAAVSAAPSAVLFVHARPDWQPGRTAAHLGTTLIEADTGPPLPIRFCSLLL